jgi:transcriptional regulator GlxA family with amidase domain
MFQTTMQTSPKEFARLVRFEYVRDTLWRTPDSVLADIALEAGYSDQAHMQREFRRFSRRTPRQFVADMQQLRSLLTLQSGRNLQDA